MTEEEYKEVAREFAKRLKPWRLAANLTQRDLSELCGISANSISLIETGEHRATKRHMLAIIKHGFEVSFERFFTETPMQRIRRQRVTGCAIPNLRAWRMYRGLSGKKLAVRVQKSAATISYIENGGNASFALAQKLALALGTTLEEMERSPLQPIDYDPEAAILNGRSKMDIAREFDEAYVKEVRDRMSNQEIDEVVSEWLGS